jgi:hypothetical protein
VKFYARDFGLLSNARQEPQLDLIALGLPKRDLFQVDNARERRFKSHLYGVAPRPGLEPGTYGLTENQDVEKPI